jgi:methanogenic corrinoid protein MtbC1
MGVTILSGVSGHLNIAAVARRTGVAADTLRKWEQRYGVLRPMRSSGGQRRYNEVDVGRVEWLKERLSEGYRIGEAAAMIGDESVEAPRTPAKLRDALYDSIARTDLAAARSLLDQAFAVEQLPRALTQVIAPLLTRTGEGWASGELSVAQEHVLSAEVRARLHPLLASGARGVRGTAVLACAPGERHELGLLMLGVLMRADGWRVVYLGADMPIPAAASMAEWVEARALCVSAAMQDRVERLGRELKSAKLPPQMSLVLGGRGIDAGAARAVGAHHSPGDLGAAVRDLRKLAS